MRTCKSRVVAEVRSQTRRRKYLEVSPLWWNKLFQNIAKIQRGFSLKTRKVPPERVWDEIVWSLEVPWLVWEPDWRRPEFWNTRGSADPVFEVIIVSFRDGIPQFIQRRCWVCGLTDSKVTQVSIEQSFFIVTGPALAPFHICNCRGRFVTFQFSNFPVKPGTERSWEIAKRCIHF